MALIDEFPVMSRVRYEDTEGRFTEGRPCLLEGRVANGTGDGGVAMQVRSATYRDTGEVQDDRWMLFFREGRTYPDASRLERVQD